MTKRRRKKRTRKIVFDRIKIGMIFLFTGILYFFLLYTTRNSPLFHVLNWVPNFLFGKMGAKVLFIIVTLLGIGILLKKDLYYRGILKKGFFLLLVILPILNFPYLNIGDYKIMIENGGMLSVGILKLFDYLLGGKIVAIKGVLLIIAILVIIWILYTLNVKVLLPKIEYKQEKLKSKKISSKTTTDKLIKEVNKKHQDNTDNIKTTISSIFKKSEKEEIKKVFSDKLSKKEHKAIDLNFPNDIPTFNINILNKDKEILTNVDEIFLKEKSEALIEKLLEFGIKVTLEGFNIGPTIIQIKIKPEAGVKLSKIESYKKDLSGALKTKSLRVIAPIPGTDYVGIEIGNPKPRIVRLREVLESKNFVDLIRKTRTNLSLGLSINNEKKIFSLEKMPHLLVAGATNSGKSVGINNFIISLIYQNSPSDLKFIMIDPKQVELSIYEGIPYLLSPIITAPDKALKVLKWATMYMDERYTKLRKNKVRNIGEYNTKFSTDKMYRVVIVIDELADLMMSSSSNRRDTELYIARIAQKARAVGIHLIVATQRPSVTVITGNIKANIPTRVAFGVVSQVDSRTIIDSKGAEDLVGKGDLLYIDSNHKYPLRIQAPFVSTLETESLVESIKNKYMKGLNEKDIYHPEIINVLESKVENSGSDGTISEGDDLLVEQAIQIISETKKASATMLQRKLGIGFARAARIMDILEEKGVIGPQDGAKPREIYI